MRSAIYITADDADAPGGGGQVVRNELAALRRCFDDVTLLDRKALLPPEYAGHDLPFLVDYFALSAVSKLPRPNLVHFYSGCFTETVRYLAEHAVRTTYTCPAHDRAVTMEEHRALEIPYPYPHLANDALWEKFSEGLRLADTVIAPSWHSKTFLESISVRRIEIIGHGADIPDTPPPLPEEFGVGYLGAVGPDKGLLYLVRAWGGFVRDLGTLYLAGRGTEGLEGMIRREVDRGRFRLLGYVEHAADFFAEVSVYVQPSVTESMGIEVIEAMGHGRPVVVSDGVGAADVVKGSDAGFVVPRRSPEALAERIAFFADNPSAVQEMGAAARRKAEFHTWERVQRSYVDLWRPALVGA